MEGTPKAESSRRLGYDAVIAELDRAVRRAAQLAGEEGSAGSRAVVQAIEGARALCWGERDRDAASREAGAGLLRRALAAVQSDKERRA